MMALSRSVRSSEPREFWGRLEGGSGMTGKCEEETRGKRLKCRRKNSKEIEKLCTKRKKEKRSEQYNFIIATIYFGQTTGCYVASHNTQVTVMYVGDTVHILKRRKLKLTRFSSWLKLIQG